MLADNTIDWTAEWKQAGIQEGLQRGMQQGMQQGERAVLKRQLTRRFGPLPGWAQARLDAADVTTLEQWADRVLEAETLEQVLS